MAIGKNKAVYVGEGGKNDIKLSLKDYYDMVKALREDHLSKNASLKYKNLFVSNFNQFQVILLTSAVLPLIVTNLVLLPVRRFHSGYKIAFPLFTFLYVFKCRENFSVQTNRRLYTEIFTEENEDGVYLRRTLRERTPNLWSHVSSQLFKLGYNFDEMLEIGNKEIPTAMINKGLLD